MSKRGNDAQALHEAKQLKNADNWKHLARWHGLWAITSYKRKTRATRPLAGAERSGFSVNHGAGRRLSRSAATRELSQRQIDDEYAAAGILVNTDGRVPLDEAAPCYKSSEEVIRAVTEAGLAEVVHKLWPLASLKGTDERRSRKKKGLQRKKTSQHY